MAKQDMDDYTIEEWTPEQIAEQKAAFPLSEPKSIAVTEGREGTSSYMVVGFFDSREEADAFLVTLEREALIEASFLKWVKEATQTFVSDYDEVRKVVRAAL
ncbi:hypothetical protein LCGC14_1350970 [marine sediment metagenome]|uniref:Uncharacterized protein n=1 Tax=marine sediment metagenome TaxID=412755 RepID=A0A0F9MRQ6_9ZZZZ